MMMTKKRQNHIVHKIERISVFCVFFHTVNKFGSFDEKFMKVCIFEVKGYAIYEMINFILLGTFGFCRNKWEIFLKL